MKKIAVLFAAFICSSFLFAADFTAKVVSVSGKVEVLKGNEWKTLAAGDSLKSGDTVQTGFRSSAVLNIKDSTVNVTALTRMTVEQLSETSEKDNVRVFVKTGGVSSNVQKSNGKKVGFTVRTPVATASVRGTEFSVENTFDATQVNTTRGKVAVWNGKNSENVSSDSTSSAAESNQNNDGDENNTNASDSSFENAPHGALTVAQNQGTNLDFGGNVSSQRETAENGAHGDIGRGMGNPSDKNIAQNLNSPNVNTIGTSASLIVNITVKE